MTIRKDKNMGLTVAEKEHWKDRIARRIERRIEEIVARRDPAFLQHTEEEARRRARESLGVDSQHDEMEKLRQEEQEIERRQKRLRAEQRAVLNGTTPEEELERGGYYGMSDPLVDGAVRKRAEALEAELLSETELGLAVLALGREEENLLDTVWLATSCKQIKALWEDATALLEGEPTALEGKALKMEPLDPE